MIQKFDLMNIVSSYSLHDCYIDYMEFKDGELKFYIEEILPETEAGYDDSEDFSNKYKSLIVTYKIRNENLCHMEICQIRWFLAWSYNKIKFLELHEFVDYFKKIKSKKGTKVAIYYQLFANSLCHIDMESRPGIKYAWDSCKLHLNVESITYEWSEKPLDSKFKVN